MSLACLKLLLRQQSASAAASGDGSVCPGPLGRLHTSSLILSDGKGGGGVGLPTACRLTNETDCNRVVVFRVTQIGSDSSRYAQLVLHLTVDWLGSTLVATTTTTTTLIELPMEKSCQ